jgi:alpha-galactosidase
VVRQDAERLERRRSVLRTPMLMRGRRFERGLGSHAVGHVRIVSPEPIERFAAWVGVDENERTRGGQGSVVFSVMAGGRELFRSRVLRGGDAPEKVDLAVGGATILDLHAGDAGDGIACDHADWADAAITLRGGKTVWLDELEEARGEAIGSRYPFSFVYDGKPGDDALDAATRQVDSKTLADGRVTTTTTWSDAKTGLRIAWELARFADFPAAEWILHFENTGKADTPIIEDVQALDLTLDAPLSDGMPYRLHKTNGAPSNPSDFEATAVAINEKHSESLGGGGGRSSNRDFPFLKIETGRGSLIAAVGWSGQWQARAESPDGKRLRLRAGLEKTRFLLHPGERVRSPRILILCWEGETWEANAQFRQLIYKHYVARRAGARPPKGGTTNARPPKGGTTNARPPEGGTTNKKPLPTLFCNTCFTRGGGWLNECNAGNQISLIKAYAPLGLEALLTDAGWFEGGWPAGAGNWTPRKDAYPQGMAPVAAAAKANGMVYGLWFEPERVVAGTWLHKHHPEWLLATGKEPQGTYLLNFGLREVQDYFFGIVKGFMDLPGFRVYRQDFNMDPLAYWRHSDTSTSLSAGPPDRQGITEMKYIEGLYAYWDRIATAWPDALMEECASGGRRIDIETLRRMHIHQKTDYWFDNETDQASLWGLSQYLPNNVVVAHLNRLDDYSFHSTLASSLCLGWITDAPDFDAARGKKLLDRYRAVRHLLIGAWYPLLPQSRDTTHWLAMQFHRPDLNEGMLLAFRHPESPYPTAEVSLRALDPKATYELRSDATGAATRAKGADLMARFQLTIPERHRSDLIIYRKVAD